MAPPAAGLSRWKPWVLAAALVALAARLWSAATSELMIDEVWSALRLENSASLWDAVSVRHDNNHPLNTAAMYLVAEAGGSAFRWLAVASGLALVLAAFFRERRRGGAWFVLPGLFATSLSLTMLASEARGYMPMLLFAYVAHETLFATFRPDAARTSPRALAAAGLLFASCVLAFLAHFSFVFWLAGLGAAFAVDVARERRRDQLATGAAFAAVGALVLVVYLGFIRSMELGSWGGGMPPAVAMALSLAQTLGAYTSLPWGIAIAAPALVFLAFLGLRGVLLRDAREAAFFAVAIVLAPALVLSVLEESRMPTLGPRYFIGPSFAFLLLFVRGLRTAFDGLAARALFAAYLSLGAAGSVLFAADGRGDYRGALAFMAAHSERDRITLSTDHDFRNWVLLRHYRDAASPRKVIYMNEVAARASAPDWYLAHRVPGAEPAPPALEYAGQRYEQVAAFGASELVGFRCYLYRRAP